MNKEYKFRAWHIKDKKYYNVLELNLDSRLVIIKSDKPNIMKEALRFDEIVLEECINFRDKNGTLIYEGDVIQNVVRPNNIFPNIYTIIYDDLRLRLIDESKECYWELIDINYNNYEIIGNVHEGVLKNG